MKKLTDFFNRIEELFHVSIQKAQAAFKDKDNIHRLGVMIVILLLLAATIGIAGWLILGVYNFLNRHMGEMVLIAISIGAIFAFFQSGRDKREARRRKAQEEHLQTLIPKANAIHDKIGHFLLDILQDRSITPLLGLAVPRDFSNLILENPGERIQIKSDASGYILSYRVEKLSLDRLDGERLFTIRDVLQGAINQRISALGINGLCPAKPNTFLHLMGQPSDRGTFLVFSLDYNEAKVTASYSESPVMYGLGTDRDYGR